MFQQQKLVLHMFCVDAPSDTHGNLAKIPTLGWRMKARDVSPVMFFNFLRTWRVVIKRIDMQGAGAGVIKCNRQTQGLSS